jgi:hypothetical protein
MPDDDSSIAVMAESIRTPRSSSFPTRGRFQGSVEYVSMFVFSTTGNGWSRFSGGMVEVTLLSIHKARRPRKLAASVKSIHPTTKKRCGNVSSQGTKSRNGEQSRGLSTLEHGPLTLQSSQGFGLLHRTRHFRIDRRPHVQVLHHFSNLCFKQSQ